MVIERSHKVYQDTHIYLMNVHKSLFLAKMEIRFLVQDPSYPTEKIYLIIPCKYGLTLTSTLE